MTRLPLILTLLSACSLDGSLTPTTDVGTRADAEVQGETTQDITPEVAADTDEPADAADTALADTALAETRDTSIFETSDTTPEDTTADASPADTSPADTGSPDATDGDTGDVAAGNCLLEHAPGDRFPVGDHCNFCVCQTDGSSACTQRRCMNERPSCDYGNVTYPYGKRFAADDRCNECVCAASGLACTRRCSGLPEEGAILVEDMDAPCGEGLTFTANNVLSELPVDDVTAPFTYRRAGGLYPETARDTSGRLRIVYEGGFVVCRLPSIEQPAFDIEVAVEWMTGDGAFDEGIHTYLRKNGFGFVDAWWVLGTWRHGTLDGTYRSSCLDPNGYGFSAQIDRDGTVSASMTKTCETDIALEIGGLSAP